jgi:2-iminobutanoate/2-iminopropanoate deaminase
MAFDHHTQINSPALASPRGHFSQAVRAGGTVYVAGLLAFDPDGDLVGPGDIAAQTARIFDILETILAEAEMTVANVVQLTTYVTDIAQRDPVNQLRAERFGKCRPASTLVEVSGLAAVGAVIEVDAIAVAEAARPTPA